MIILYLGMGKEATPETVAWANSVLKTYSHRTAILAMHEYLNPQGSFVTYARGEEVFNQIIVPNDNVAMVLCGHDPGASRNIREVPGSDRKVVEILSDYQNAEKGGNGFLRLLQFVDGKLVNKTYSPITDTYNCFAAEKDEFTVDLHMTESKRIAASKDFSAAFCSETAFASARVESGETATAVLKNAEIDFTGWFAVITDQNGNSVQTPVQEVKTAPVDPGEQDPDNGNGDGNQQGGDGNNGNSNVPATGDARHLPALACILLMSAAGFVVLKKKSTR